MRVIALVTVTVSLLVPTPTLARMGRCRIEVDGRPYLSGRCNIEREADGSVQVGVGSADDKVKPSRHFAYVTSEGGGRGTAYWNGRDGGSHAHDPLGTVTRQGACWRNARATICAWAQ